MSAELSLLRLLQLCSASLPVGAYAFSQGLEGAIEQGKVADVSAVKEWVSLSLAHSLAKTDAPILLRMIVVNQQTDKQRLHYWNNYLLACRESHELRLSDVAMGAALKRVLLQLGAHEQLLSFDELAYATAFAIAVDQWRIDCLDAVHGFLWSWLENQIAAATKLLPMGQSQAQQLLFELASEIPTAIKTAQKVNDKNIGASMPGFAMISAWHETQYSRLYRS